MAPKAWRCSQCGAVNEPGARACSECGKWPSLFDLQDSTTDEVEREVDRGEIFEAETFEPEIFRQEPAEEDAGRRGRFPRWLVTAVWVTGLIIWIVVNAITDSS